MTMTTWQGEVDVALLQELAAEAKRDGRPLAVRVVLADAVAPSVGLVTLDRTGWQPDMRGRLLLSNGLRRLDGDHGLGGVVDYYRCLCGNTYSTRDALDAHLGEQRSGEVLQGWVRHG